MAQVIFLAQLPVPRRVVSSWCSAGQRSLVPVVGALEPSDPPPDFSFLDVDDGPLGLVDAEPE
jgi:hypothetical protein